MLIQLVNYAIMIYPFPSAQSRKVFGFLSDFFSHYDCDSSIYTWNYSVQETIGILNYLIQTEIHLATSIYMPAGLDDPNEPRHFLYLLLTCFRVRYWKLNNHQKIFPFHCFLYQANLSLVPYWRLFLNDTFLFIVCIFSLFLSSAWALCHICLPFLACLPQLMVHTNLSRKVNLVISLMPWGRFL